MYRVPLCHGRSLLQNFIVVDSGPVVVEAVVQNVGATDRARDSIWKVKADSVTASSREHGEHGAAQHAHQRACLMVLQRMVQPPWTNRRS